MLIRLASVVMGEYRLGPAMGALNERQRKFVIAMLEFPSINYKRAALEAGYSGTGVAVQAHRLAHDEKIQAAILEESKRRLNAGIAMATSRLLEIAEASETPLKERLRALDMVLNRGGIPELKEQKVTVEHVQTEEQTLARLARLAAKLGITQEKLLGSVGAKLIDGKIIDAEFTEVTDETVRGVQQTALLGHTEHSSVGGDDDDPFAFNPSED